VEGSACQLRHPSCQKLAAELARFEGSVKGVCSASWLRYKEQHERGAAHTPSQAPLYCQHCKWQMLVGCGELEVKVRNAGMAG
jgi:hypothetical protein